MSYGALSPEAKEALARGATAAGTAIASGEGGAHPRERDNAERYIFEMASGYFGWTEENICKASAIEVKIGQGAKPGLGGTLLGSKVTAEIAAVRGVPPGTDVHSPAHFPDIHSKADLARRVSEIKEMTGGVPVGIKFAAGDVERDVAAALECGADYITVDGLGGGTGAAPVHVKDNVGIPSAFGLYRARRFLENEGVTDVQLVATGGFRAPNEMAKALALGADAVALATASLMAIGCQQYRACHSGGCPVGIATQNPKPPRPAGRGGVGPPPDRVLHPRHGHDGGLRPRLRARAAGGSQPHRPGHARSRAGPANRSGVGGMSTTTLAPLPEAFAETRDALHRLAVYVLAPAQRLTNGEIILRATPGGFSTFEYDGHVVGVDGDQLVVDATHRPITTLNAAAAAVGITPDVAQQEQFDVPPHGDLDEPLAVDGDAARALGDWYRLRHRRA